MLSSMRTSKKNKPFVFALLGLLAFGLVGFASGGVSSTRIKSVGTVGDEPIPVNAYAQSLRSTVQNISQQIGRQLTAQEVFAFGLQNTALQNVVSGAALSSEAERLGLSAGNDQVALEIFATSTFFDMDGNFDEQRYKSALQRANMTPKEYEAETRKAIARGLIESAVAAGSDVPQTQAMALITFAREKRSFDYAILDMSALDTLATDPTEAQIFAQYENEPALYTAPLTRKITYVTVSPEMMAALVDVPAGTLEQEYKDQEARFNRPARRLIDRISFATTEDAQTAKEQMAENVITFDALAQERGLSTEDIDLGEVEEGTLDSDIDAALFEANTLGLFGPFDTDIGPALFRVNATFNSQNTPFEDAKEELSAEYVGNESRRLIIEMVSDLDELLAQGISLEDLADETELTLGQIDLTDQSQDSIAAYAEFRDVALSVTDSDFPEIKDLSDGGIFALRLDEIIEPVLRPLADVRDQVATDWAQATNQAALNAKASDIAQQLDAGVAFDALGLTAQSQTDITRDAFVEDVPATQIQDLFAINTGKTNTNNVGETVVVARVQSITPFDPSTDENKALIAQVKMQLGNQVTGDLLQLFSTALEARDGVKFDQNAINQVNTQILGGTGG